MGQHSTRLYADYGVFSSRSIDAGTKLLLDVALSRSRVGSVADVGTGYGPLAIGMILNGRTDHVVASDTDCLALHLTQLNAHRLGVAVDLSTDPDPFQLPETSLTLCNVPTHLSRGASEELLDGLANRARDSPVLLVVHRSLEDRYAQHLRRRGLSVDHRRGDAHVVLESTGSRP